MQFYANALNCSPKTLNIACQNETGDGVKALIEKRLLLESKRLLVHSKLSINAIADELGFIDGTQFAKFFKKYEGRTANEFRSRYGLRTQQSQSIFPKTVLE
ncbi:MAG: helix-turn-helix domain-containing protein [Moraxella equi]|nr:helix-turn-helix domain-containing protein [Moraxella equi]